MELTIRNRQAIREKAHMDERDIWRSAALLIKQHGAEAEDKAAKQGIALMNAGDPRGAAAFMSIVRAIRKLNETSRVGLPN
jgi:histidine ammonia-lyase